MNPVVIVLASGRGERFLASGGTTHKLQALLGGKTVLQHTLDAVRLSGLPCHLEQADHPGMGDSIAAAVRASSDAEGWMILPADLPLVLPETLSRLAAVPAQYRVARPRYQGQQGHPVRFSRDCLPALLALQGNQGAAPVVRLHQPFMLDVEDAGCVMDVDTTQDLLQVAQALRQRAAG